MAKKSNLSFSVSFPWKIFAVLISISLNTQGQVDRMEPPFWYSGMNNTELQIMFYGKNIAENEVSVSGNTRIKEVIKTENANYLFVNLDTKNTAPQDLIFTFTKKNKIVFTRKYTLRQRRQNSAQRHGFDAADMIYLLMPDRFANGDPNNDSQSSVTEQANRNFKYGRHGGDIEGIIQHLDYLNELGVTALWPTPLCEDNQKEGSYHGYAQTDVYKIDPRYGTNEDYLRLSAELHKRGMKLIQDYVTNHWGSEHWMVKDLPSKEWLHQFPVYTQSNFRLTTQTDFNASKYDKSICTDGWFDKSMADLNQANPLVLKYIIQNAIWWIEYADLDGLRVDTYPYNDKAGIASWTKAITDEYPNFNIVGEVWISSQAQIAFWQKDSKIGAMQFYNSYLPSVMDFPLMETLTNVFRENQNIIKIYETFTSDFLFPNTNNIMVFAENHDTKRLNEMYKNDFNKYRMAMTIIATVRGIPELYYGSEIGLAENKNDGYAANRMDFPGGWKNDSLNAFTQAGRTPQQEKFYSFTSRLFQWRKTNEAVHFGNMMHYIPQNNVYVYFRFTDNQTVMVVINNGNSVQQVKTIRYIENLGSYTIGKDILSDRNIDLSRDFIIEPQSELILELK